jgi:hypothetical protein
MRAGLKVETPGDVQRNVPESIGKIVDDATGVKLASTVLSPVAFVQNKINAATWDYMHAGIKIALALKEVETLSINNAKAHAAKPEKVPLKTEEQIHQDVAQYANDLTGSLDWFRIATESKTQLGRQLAMQLAGPAGQRWAQIINFAPDWTVSTLRAGFKAFEQSDTGLRGLWKPENATDLYRRYALKSFLVWLTLQNGFNIAMSGQPIWENNDPTRINMGDGTTLNAGKHTNEFVHLMDDPLRFAYNKLGIGPKMVIDRFTGREGYGEKAPKYDSFGKHVAESALPFTLSSTRQRGISGEEKLKRAAWSEIGFIKSGMTDEEKTAWKTEDKAERAKKQKELLQHKLDSGNLSYEEEQKVLKRLEKLEAAE